MIIHAFVNPHKKAILPQERRGNTANNKNKNKEAKGKKGALCKKEQKRGKSSREKGIGYKGLEEKGKDFR